MWRHYVIARSFFLFSSFNFFYILFQTQAKSRLVSWFHMLSIVFSYVISLKVIQRNCTISDWESEMCYYTDWAFCYANCMLLNFKMRTNHGRWNEEERNEKMDSKGILFIWLKAENAQKPVGTRIGQAWHFR